VKTYAKQKFFEIKFRPHLESWTFWFDIAYFLRNFPLRTWY